MTMKAPAGPPICTCEPPSSEMISPAMMAVNRPASGLHARGDGKGHRQRQRHDAHRDAGAQVGTEALAVVALQGVEQARPEAVQGGQGHAGHHAPVSCWQADGPQARSVRQRTRMPGTAPGKGSST